MYYYLWSVFLGVLCSWGGTVRGDERIHIRIHLPEIIDHLITKKMIPIEKKPPLMYNQIYTTTPPILKPPHYQAPPNGAGPQTFQQENLYHIPEPLPPGGGPILVASAPPIIIGKVAAMPQTGKLIAPHSDYAVDTFQPIIVKPYKQTKGYDVREFVPYDYNKRVEIIYKHPHMVYGTKSSSEESGEKRIRNYQDLDDSEEESKRGRARRRRRKKYRDDDDANYSYAENDAHSREDDEHDYYKYRSTDKND